MKEFKLCGLGNALVDIFLEISEEEFRSLGFQRGGMQLVDVGEVPFRDLSDYVERTFRHVAESKKLEFIVDAAPNLPRGLQIEFSRIVQDFEAYRALADEIDRHRDQLGPILREQLGNAAAITPDTYDTARRTARRARQLFAELMAETDVILTPSAPSAAPPCSPTGGRSGW